MAQYKRYIDYILLIWEGPQEGLRDFLERLNLNDYGLLELVLFKMEGKINMKTYFKETDQNSYIPTMSCHHKKMDI